MKKRPPDAISVALKHPASPLDTGLHKGAVDLPTYQALPLVVVPVEDDLFVYISASDYFPPLYLGVMDGHLPTCQAPSLVKDDLCSKYSDPIQSAYSTEGLMRSRVLGPLEPRIAVAKRASKPVYSSPAFELGWLLVRPLGVMGDELPTER
ncbi:hypothetical protein CPB84DRAFT_1753048 [Gymnopilus junonius]|uniref:Uncharacterized protein n=1 Tax=Gymnopilus junonius TaxID=109634 RepID=A0A9P5N8S3_GYMJU|nr:hypothetical protein CPB84DRAFT_1753048 [Gymnopilus junonius]